MTRPRTPRALPHRTCTTEGCRGWAAKGGLCPPCKRRGTGKVVERVPFDFAWKRRGARGRFV